MCQFYFQVDVDPELREDIALQRTSFNPPRFKTNPKNTNDVAEAFLAFMLIRHSKVEAITFKKLRRISLTIKIVGTILLILSLILSFYQYRCLVYDEHRKKSPSGLAGLSF